MHGAGQRGVCVEVERDLAEIDPAPVGQVATVKAQRDDRTAIRIGRQSGTLKRQCLKGNLFGGGVPATRALLTNRPRVHLEAFDDTHLLFHFTPVRGELHHRH
ncbi:hypothetical protein D3C85_1169080 [compost metagenome]